MAIIDIFRKKKVTPQDIRLEKIRLERREKKLSSQMEKVAKEKEELFRKGAECGSKSLRMIYARKFEESTKRLQLLEREAQRLWKELRVITSLDFACRRVGSHEGASLLSRIGTRELTELVKLIETDDLKGQAFVDRIEEILGTVDSALPQEEPVGEEGREILKLWEKMDEGKLDFKEGYRKASEEAEKGQREPN